MANNIYGLTDTGRVRGNNEDTFIALPVLGNQYLLACVIDGVGGYHGGEVAAEIAREQILYQFAVKPSDMKTAMLEAFKQANENIFSERQRVKEMDSMACVATLAIVDIENNQLHYAHIGDTRLYLLRDKSLIKITKDHSFVGFLEDSGRLTESAAMNHPKRNEINKALGFASPINTDGDYIETGQSPFLPGDMLLLCSDGLTDMVDKDTITNIITSDQSLQQMATNLVEAANLNGGKDNVTVVLVKNDKAPVVQEAVQPATAVKKKPEPSPQQPPLQQPTRQQPVQPKPQPVSAPVAEPVVAATQKPKSSSSGLTMLLVVLCLALLASTVWFYLQSKKGGQSSSTVVKPDSVARNPSEIKLQQLINSAKGDTVLLTDSAFKSPVVISSAIQVQQDTLYIKAKGKIELKADSAYSGPALLLASNCKVVVLDSLQFSNFKVGISVFNDALKLKHTQFNQCPSAVQVNYALADNQPINGRSPVSKFKSDSLASSTSKTNGSR
ncbi:PP2C family protein-serine/threonine phosphatase [Mucilaginibacter lacusdianchii]|uniref:PP2C family protein-serine/threonine phosphatase n=1 Tax=Mucilaginibacter lacusdianchii TaxID=2684211 RepID=UPI00131D914B|nr:protein phosphatase 2C domain-containing protein [Mucilaginibacter sp. JXJ CY 39]